MTHDPTRAAAELDDKQLDFMLACFTLATAAGQLPKDALDTIQVIIESHKAVRQHAHATGRQAGLREAATTINAMRRRKLASMIRAETEMRMQVASHRQSDIETCEELVRQIDEIKCEHQASTGGAQGTGIVRNAD